jgi:tRNA (mo5U34)-methyltransferase
MSQIDTTLEQVRGRRWFYEFDLPDGSRTTSYLPPAVAKIHTTRLEMLLQGLAPIAGDDWSTIAAVDLACHQGFFATHLARKGCRDVLAIDARAEHVADAALMAEVYGLNNLRTLQADANRLDAANIGTFDITLLLGLLYHVENPVGVMRIARALTRRACVIETQVVPNMTGVVDWGAYTFQRSMIGSFAIIDETGETHAPEASITGICLCPSYEALVWVLLKVGFARVERIAAPPGAYEQHASGKRVVVIAHVTD